MPSRIHATDAHWESYGRLNPYFGVITDPQFDAGRLDACARQLFFETGEVHVARLITSLEQRFGSLDWLRSGLDFGCGVGRLLIPLARRVPGMTGVDVSPSMLQEARKNIDDCGLKNISLVETMEHLPDAMQFDLVHSFIVLQHIPERRGQRIIETLLERLRQGGIGVLHVLYHNPYAAFTLRETLHSWYSAINIWVRTLLKPQEANAAATSEAPPMEMNPYDLSRIMRSLHLHGVREFHGEMSDHGGFLGITLSFRKPVASPMSADSTQA